MSLGSELAGLLVGLGTEIAAAESAREAAEGSRVRAGAVDDAARILQLAQEAQQRIAAWHADKIAEAAPAAARAAAPAQPITASQATPAAAPAPAAAAARPCRGRRGRRPPTGPHRHRGRAADTQSGPASFASFGAFNTPGAPLR